MNMAQAFEIPQPLKTAKAGAASVVVVHAGKGWASLPKALSSESREKIQMRLISLILILFLMASACADDSATKKCTQAEAMQAEKEADSLKNWDQIYRAYKRFSHCDDG